MNQKLYDDLVDLRAKLKFKHMENGRMPVVCTDDALRELALKAPRHKKELEYISGLGRVFLEKYGDDFMAVLDAHNNRDAAAKTLTHDVRMTLKNLETRLINVNKRNRLLYQPKLSDKTAIDLYSEKETQNKKITDFLLSNGGSAIKLCDLNAKEESKRLFKRLVTIYRETQRTLRESGQLDLYVGYPYVLGKINGIENFDVRAPLALFPAELIRGVDGFSLKIDDKRDVLFNNNLILCQYKMNNISRPLPNSAAEKESRKNFKEEMENFYAEAGIKIEAEFGAAEKFREYLAEEFPATEAGVFEVQNNAVLGRFSLYSSAMQRDFGKILERGEINDNLYNLLDKEGTETPAREQSEIAEENLFYITDLNYSQEKVLEEAEKGSIVIQGPPGTGKSQAIVSIISDAVHSGKTVLMVSQKKAAVDVIYSRLGNLGRYALFVDDAKNKEAFYRQIGRLINVPDEKEETASDFEGLSGRITRRIERLDGINAELYTMDEKGNVFGKIFAENALNPFISGDFEAASKIEPLISAELRELSYADLKACRAVFEDGTLLAEALEYFTLAGQYPFLTELRTLGKLELYNLKAAAENFFEAKAEHRKLGLFKRIANRARLKRELKEVVKQFFTGKKHFRKLFKNPEFFEEGTAQAEKFLAAKQEISSLTAQQREYGRAAFELVGHDFADSADVNCKTFEILAFLLMDRFIKMHPALMSDASSYNDLVARISDDMNAKRKMSRNWMRDNLYGFAEANILTAKRLGEMKRAVESKRKPSVQRFVEKFAFELFKGIKIWIMTTDTVSEILPCEELFDTVIFDEASQIYIEKTVPSFARAKTAVISGDHKQLRPSSLGVGRAEYEDESETEEEVTENAVLEEESLLDLTRFKFPEVMLNYHYRSRYRELIEFSNRVFYGGRLFVAPNIEIPSAPPIEVRKVDGLWANRQNRAEAEEVVRLVKELFASRAKNETIGIVTFNSAQRDLVTDLLDAAAAEDGEFGAEYLREQNRTENGEDVGLFIKNIENVQGDERDIMIFSVAYAKSAKDGRVVRNYGWLNNIGGENRLNVAVTRAKSKIYVVTSVTPEQLITDDLANEGPKIFKKYLEYAYAVSGGDADRINGVLDGLGGGEESAAEQKASAVRDALYKRLTEAGYTVKTNIGVGDYKIDLAVTDQSGKYLLGVEIDSSVYGKGGARERDVHRRRYLAVKGWKIHRVFSVKFDLDGETETIIKKIT